MGLFVAVCVALIGFAVLLGRSPDPPGEPPKPSPPTAERTPGSGALAHARREEARLRAAGRRFVSAFLRYEVGDLSRRDAASIRLGATAAFARELAAAPPRHLDRTAPEAARIERIDISFLSGSARRALLSGVASRPDGPEEFSFLFALRSGRWLAIGAAE
jgi:hypothetical protein